MHKREYGEQLRQGHALIAEIQDEEIGRLERATLPKDRRAQLKDYEDLAKAEARVKRSYHGRYLFELIQNANDAIVEAEALRAESHNDHHLVRLELSNQSLLVANYGEPFHEENVRALCRLGKAMKYRISKQIGHKGIGFKSVLEVCKYPEIYSGKYAFGFDGDQFHREVEAVLGRQVDARLPMLRTPYTRDLYQLPPAERARVETLFDEGYVTVVRLPLHTSVLDEVAEHMVDLIQPSLLLFMTGITQIEMAFPDGREVVYHSRVRTRERSGLSLVLLYEGEKDPANDHLHSRWLRMGPVECDIPDREMVLALDEEAWHDVTALRFAIAFPLREQENLAASLPFYVYFPTEEFCGLSFAIHGDFHVGDDRRTLPLNDLNKWLIEEICSYLAIEGMELLKDEWPRDAGLVERLAPISQPERDFPKYFMGRYLAGLRLSPFVPIDGGHYKAPEAIRMPPAHADPERFRQLFPASRLRGKDDWAYPLPAVVHQEQDRNIPFLLSEALGAANISPEQIVEHLRDDGLPPVENASELIAFLADWHAELPGPERRVFIEQLQSLPIYPTVSGWSQPGTALVFQANVRAEVDEDTVPDGFAFSLIHRSVYPAERGATASNQYKLFEALGAREYNRRSLIVEAILPVLTNEQRFSELLSTHSDSIFQAYRLLCDYFEEGGTTRDFEQRLARVPVPTQNEDGSREWRPANECYFGPNWPGQNGGLLRQIYQGYPDCYFLADIPQLGPDEPEERQEWAAFFRWLGVADRPRVIESNRRIERRAAPPLEGMSQWNDYLKSHDDDFRCPNPAAYHGYSRGLQSIHVIHHFADLVRENDAQKLLDLFVLLGNYWESHYKSLSRTTIACDRRTCAHDRIDDYLLFELQHTSWLPAQVSDNWTEPLSPRQIWSLGETDPLDARALVPTLPEELRLSEYREFIAALGFVSSSTAGIEDYVRLLSLLPERYPVEPTSLPEFEHRRWQRSLAAVFNWICERIQAGLVSRGENSPAPPTDLQVLAYLNDKPVYVPLGSPQLVYANDNFLADRWKEQCAFLRINDDWRTLLSWLGVPDLSDVVRSEWQPIGELERESKQLSAKFERTLPYYLSLIKHTQPANYDRLVPRLLRLDLHVVKELSTKEWLDPLPEVQPVVSHVEVHLEKREDPNPGAGRRFVIAGDLFVAREAANNLDLLGDYIADYIEIARLADAFVILINRQSEQEKWRFLKSKGVSEDTLAEVLSDIQNRADPDGWSGRTELTIAEMVKRITVPAEAPEVAPTPAGPGEPAETTDELPVEETETDGEKEELAQGFLPEYPELELDELPGVQTAEPGDLETVSTENGEGKERGKGGSGIGHIPRQEVTEALGRRGEKWAYENEKLRLQIEYGFDPQELEELEELVWVSRRKPAANYDIKSIRVTESGEQRSVYIEVKASAGDSRQIRMRRQEFHLALSLGEDYWLYWVANVDEAKPDTPVCYENVARLVAEEQLTIDVDTLALTLPRPHKGSRVEPSREAEVNAS